MRKWNLSYLVYGHSSVVVAADRQIDAVMMMYATVEVSPRQEIPSSD